MDTCRIVVSGKLGRFVTIDPSLSTPLSKNHVSPERTGGGGLLLEENLAFLHKSHRIMGFCPSPLITQSKSVQVHRTIGSTVRTIDSLSSHRVNECRSTQRPIKARNQAWAFKANTVLGRTKDRQTGAIKE